MALSESANLAHGLVLGDDVEVVLKIVVELLNFYSFKPSLFQHL